MSIRYIVMILLSALFFNSTGFCAETSYIVTLKNGNAIEANSCTVDNGRLLLKFPVGQAEIPISQVESVKDDKGMSLDLLQVRGVWIPGLPEPKPVKGEPQNSNDCTTLPGGRLFVSQSSQGGDYTSSNKPAVSSIDDEAESKRVSDLLDSYFAATDEKEQEKLDKEIGRTIDDLFEKTGTSK